MDYDTFLCKIPKIELHCHLEGSVNVDTYIDLAKKHKVNLPSYREPIDLYTTYRNFQEFEVMYRSVASCIQDRDDFRRVTYETLAEAANCQVRYREMFWSPMDHVDMGIPYSTAVDGIIDGIRDARIDFGIECRLIPAIDRSDTPEKAVEMVQHIIDNRRVEVIGIGMDYSEEGNPPEKFWKAYQLAEQAGLQKTAHAGELGGPARNVETCLELLHCDRIDHGYRILENETIVRKCVNRGVIFTVVPTAHRLGLTDADGAVHWENHPIIQMVTKGLRVMINSDDPGIKKRDLSEVYIHAAKFMRFTPKDFKSFLLNAIDATWIDQSTKDQWKQEWIPEYDMLVSQLN
jgi:adenosine deaminase